MEQVPDDTPEELSQKPLCYGHNWVFADVEITDFHSIYEFLTRIGYPPCNKLSLGWNSKIRLCRECGRSEIRLDFISLNRDLPDWSNTWAQMDTQLQEDIMKVDQSTSNTIPPLTDFQDYFEILCNQRSSKFRDPQNKLHRVDGPAYIRPYTGTEEFWWHGVNVPRS